MAGALLLRSSDNGGLIPWCLIGIAAGLFLFFYGFRLLQKRRLILDTPFSKIRSASLGMVEISGLAVGPYTMTAPITGRACYYYRTLAWEYKQNGKNKEWVRVASESVHVPFFLDDNTGRVLVDPRGAELDLHRDFQEEYCDSFFTTKEPATEAVRSFLARHGVMTDNKIKVEEYCIKPKNSLFVLGTLAENPGIEVAPVPIHDAESESAKLTRNISISLNPLSVTAKILTSNVDTSLMSLAAHIADEGAVRQEVVLLSPTSAPKTAVEMSQQEKIAAALMRAGISNPAAWKAAGVGGAAVHVSDDPVLGGGALVSDSSAKTATTTADSSGFDTHPPVALMKGTNNKTFLISWRSQREVVRSLGWKCTLMIWGGPAVTLGSVYVLLSSMRLL